MLPEIYFQSLNVLSDDELLNQHVTNQSEIFFSIWSTFLKALDKEKFKNSINFINCY